MFVEKPYSDWVALWNKCHSPRDERNHQSVMEWAKWCENMLGPKDCQGFIIRSWQKHMNGMFLSEGHYTYVPSIKAASLYTWEVTACKITVNRKLEAIRVDHLGVAKDYKGQILGTVYNYNKDE